MKYVLVVLVLFSCVPPCPPPSPDQARGCEIDDVFGPLDGECPRDR